LPRETSELLREATEHLKKCGITEARFEAEILLAYAWARDRLHLWGYPREQVPPSVETSFRQVVESRGKKYPVAYITGVKEFYGLDFLVNPYVLIPRPETELLVDAVCDWQNKWGYRQKEFFLADLGTGSGVIAVTLARIFSRALVWAVDISREALLVARKNARRHGVDNRITFLEGDFWEAFSDKGLKFDVVVSNPPYVTSEEMDSLPCDVKKYEPSIALNGGDEGIKAYHRILNNLREHVKSPSLTVLEVSPFISDKVRELSLREKGIKKVEVLSDYRGRDRLLKISG